MLITLLFLISFSLEASFSPWGKDEGMFYSSQIEATPAENRGSLAEPLIRFHQKVISPADGPRSHFIPSSSQYTLDAFKTFGLINGFLLGCDRLTRENGEKWVYETIKTKDQDILKWDPIPRAISK
jgi:putative component of membrane protein insertase Oxa1/YidC/SpoIIIJ protein YidD